MNDIVYVGRHALMHTVQRHAHESWEFVYCTDGEGQFILDRGALPYRAGDVVVIPPMLPHANASETGFQNIHVNMVSPVMSLREAAVIQDDSNHFLLDAFTAALWHYRSDRPDRASFLAAYGSLICGYLSAYQTAVLRSPAVMAIERSISAHYADPGYRVEDAMQGMSVSQDYLRKLFQREMGFTPLRYLMEKRLQAAASLLSRGEDMDSSITVIARTCGFQEPLYFSRMFKKRFGCAPSAYRLRREEALSDGSSLKIEAGEPD